MSSKLVSSSFNLIGVDGSIAISVRSVLAETGAIARFGSEGLKDMLMLYNKRSWFARNPHEQ